MQIVDKRKNAKKQNSNAAGSAAASKQRSALAPTRPSGVQAYTSVDSLMGQIRSLPPQDLVSLAQRIMESAPLNGNGAAQKGQGGRVNSNGSVEISATVGYTQLRGSNGGDIGAEVKPVNIPTGNGSAGQSLSESAPRPNYLF